MGVKDIKLGPKSRALQVEEPPAAAPAVKHLEHGLGDCERLAAAVKEVEASFRAAVLGPLTIDALCVLIQANMPASKRPGLTTVRDILEAATSVGRYALKPGVR